MSSLGLYLVGFIILSIGVLQFIPDPKPTLDAAWAALKPGGRMVANAVTLEGEQALAGLYEARGGELLRLAVQRAGPVGGLTGWRPMMPVTQWRAVKP